MKAFFILSLLATSLISTETLAVSFKPARLQPCTGLLSYREREMIRQVFAEKESAHPYRDGRHFNLVPSSEILITSQHILSRMRARQKNNDEYEIASFYDALAPFHGWFVKITNNNGQPYIGTLQRKDGGFQLVSPSRKTAIWIDPKYFLFGTIEKQEFRFRHDNLAVRLFHFGNHESEHKVRLQKPEDFYIAFGLNHYKYRRYGKIIEISDYKTLKVQEIFRNEDDTLELKSIVSLSSNEELSQIRPSSKKSKAMFDKLKPTRQVLQSHQ